MPDMVPQTLKEIALDKAKKRPELVDYLTEESPILAMLKFIPTTHGLWNVEEVLSRVEGPSFVDLGEPLPGMMAETNLRQTYVSVLGGEMEVAKDKADQFGGAARYFARRESAILKKAGMDTELAIWRDHWRKAALKAGLVTKGGATSKCYTVMVVRFDKEINIGIYDPNGFNQGRLVDITPINGGNLYHLRSQKDVLGYGVEYQQEPHSVIWCVLANGMLAGLTFMPEQEVIGWHRHDTAGKFRDVAVIPGLPDDQTWFLVERDCGLCVERLDSFFDSEDLADAYFLDSALNYLGPAVSEFSGLEHLAGRKVQIFADGGTIDGLSVSADGELMLATPARSVHVGLAYVSRLVPNLPEVQTQQGSSMMHNRKISAVRLRIYRSMSFLAGLETLAPVTDRHIVGGAMSTYPFFSEGTDVALEACGGWTDESPLTLEVQSATPLTILALLSAMEVAAFSGKGGF